MGSVEIATPGKLRWSEWPDRAFGVDLRAWIEWHQRTGASLRGRSGPGWSQVTISPSGEVVSVADTAGNGVMR